MLPRWLTQRLACPGCGGPLAFGPGVCRCARCGPYPVLGDVPLLVAAPADYCASFRESLLAALAEHGLASREAVEVVEAFAQAGRGEAQRFGDDWTADEARGEAPPTPVRGPASDALDALEAAAASHGPAAWLAERLGAPRIALELGCGAGVLSRRLAGATRRLIVADFSLRAVLQARAKATQGPAGSPMSEGEDEGQGARLPKRRPDRPSEGRPRVSDEAPPDGDVAQRRGSVRARRRGPADVAGVVLDAEAMPMVPGSVDLVVAEHLVDLLDHPEAFLTAVARALVPRGRALVTTPAPTLGASGDAHLERLARRAGFAVGARGDGLPWLRRNSERHLEVYLVAALELLRR